MLDFASFRRCARSARLLLLLSTSGVMLSGCWAVGPDFTTIKSEALSLVGFEGSAQDTHGFINQAAQSEAQTRTSMSRWWEDLNDPLLNSYVERLLTQNLDLEQATQRIIQARAQLINASSAFLPSLGASADGGRSFSSATSSGSSASSQRIYSDSYSADLSVSWQLDLFGKLRRSEEAAQASFDSTIYDREALAQSLIAALLEQRVAIAVSARSLALAQEIASTKKTALDMIERRYHAGADGTTLADLYTAQNSYDSAAADVHDYEVSLTESVYALDILLGDAPGTNDPLAQDFPLLAPPVTPPHCLPAALLDRRPDLKSSALLLKAANANIGVAVADLYPDLTLGGSLGFSSSASNTLFTADSLAGSLLATLTQKLFEGGALRANIRMAEAEAHEQAAVYAEGILTAMQEVENAMKAEYELTAKLEKSTHAAQTLKEAEKLADSRYGQGVITAQELLTARGNALSTQLSLLQAQQSLWEARTALYLALGGDWFGGPQNCPAPPAENKMDKNSQSADKEVESTQDAG